jgi:hypothetical protein
MSQFCRIHGVAEGHRDRPLIWETRVTVLRVDQRIWTLALPLGSLGTLALFGAFRGFRLCSPPRALGLFRVLRFVLSVKVFFED